MALIASPSDGVSFEIEVVFEKFGRELGRDHPALDRLRVLHEEMINLVGPNLDFK